MVNNYKLINEDLKEGVWLNTIDLINLIKFCENRNKFYYEKLVKIYEILEGKKFDVSLIKNSLGGKSNVRKIK